MDKITLNQRLASEIETHYGGEVNQKRFANDCGLSEGYISKLLNDDTDITNIRGIRELIIVAKQLGVSVDYLLGLSDVKSSTQEAKNLDYISEYTGLNADNLHILHGFASGQYTLLNIDGEKHGIYTHEEHVNQFINFYVSLIKKLAYYSFQYCRKYSSILQAKMYIEELNYDEWLLAALTEEERPESEYVFDISSPISMEKRKNSISMDLYRLVNIFDSAVKEHLEFDRIIKECNNLVDIFRKNYMSVSSIKYSIKSEEEKKALIAELDKKTKNDQKDHAKYINMSFWPSSSSMKN